MREREQIGDALDTAIKRVLEAEEQFLETPSASSEQVQAAAVVERRAEDVELLAADAREVVAADQEEPETRSS